ncbi:hypothetical protein HPP92_014333 [Vanilla planifolia]|uniref:Uncharacterized protein n=1 Tax=Vanilla planifolia TaxID=51239 RepID=A0A835R142_VANPL|nr:hypothetical protein HPP92_014333 [Vanilla planifolia]
MLLPIAAALRNRRSAACLVSSISSPCPTSTAHQITWKNGDNSNATSRIQKPSNCDGRIFGRIAYRRRPDTARRWRGTTRPDSATSDPAVGLFSYRGDVLRRSPALMEKLIGIEDPPSPVPRFGRILAGVGGREKAGSYSRPPEQCDEDLRALKRIIDVVRMAEIVRIENDRDIDGSDSLLFHWLEPSPVSALNAVALSSPTHPAYVFREFDADSLVVQRHLSSRSFNS